MQAFEAVRARVTGIHLRRWQDSTKEMTEQEVEPKIRAHGPLASELTECRKSKKHKRVKTKDGALLHYVWGKRVM